MARNVAIGIQQFDELIEKSAFYGFAFEGKRVLIG